MSKKASRTTALTLCAVVGAGVLSAVGHAPAGASQTFVSTVVAGTQSQQDGDGTLWLAQPSNFTGPVQYHTATNLIWNTQKRQMASDGDQKLYRHEAWGMTGYRLRVPYSGQYRVTLPMTELAFHNTGARVFDVTAEGYTVLSDVDDFKASGYSSTYAPSFTVNVTDGTLDLGFVNRAGHAHVSGVKVELVSTGSTPAAENTPTTPTPTVRPRTSSSSTADPTSSTDGPAPAVRFAPNNIFTRDISRAPVASDSAAMVANLNSQIVNNWGGVAATNSDQYNASFYKVAPGTKKHNVQFNDCQGKGYTPDGLLNGRGIFNQVPIPDGAVPANGTDGNLDIYDPAADKLWELWVANKDSKGNWSACWGGRIDNVSQNPGYFDGSFGTTASGISFSGSMITIAEGRAHRINHAMYMAIMAPAKYTNYSWPAQRSDGFSTEKGAIPEGTRLRLDPSVDVDSLNLTPFAKAVARAAQKYGFIVADKAGAVNVSLENGASEKARTGVDPWSQIFSDAPNYAQLKNFPWTKLQALPKDYGRGE